MLPPPAVTIAAALAFDMLILSVATRIGGKDVSPVICEPEPAPKIPNCCVTVVPVRAPFASCLSSYLTLPPCAYATPNGAAIDPTKSALLTKL